MSDIDSLEIKIQANAKDASVAIDSLVKKLDRLSASFSGVNSRGLATMGAGVNKLSNAMANFSKNTKTADFSRLARNINALGELKASSISSAASSITKMASSMKAFENLKVSDSASKLGELAKGISQLGYKSASQAVTNIPKLATAMRKFMKTLSNAPKVSQNLIDMTNAMAKFARTGSSGGKAATALSSSFASAGRSFSGFKNSFSIFSKSISKSITPISNIKSAIKSLASQAIGFTAIFSGIKKSVDISSDLTEVQNVIDVSFGKYKKTIEDFSKTSITDYGMSELTAKTMAGRFQAMGIAIGFSQKKMSEMSTDLTALAGDMASFYDVEQDAVATSLQSVFTGETEPLRKYGLDLTQATLQQWAMKNGLDANIASMSQAEKTMLRYQYVMANTGAVQGDFKRTADSWSNQVRVLKQNFEVLGGIVGGVIINAFKPFVKALNTVMEQVNKFAKIISNSLGKIFGWTYEESGGATNPADDMSDGMSDVADATDAATDAQKKYNKQLAKFDELNNYTTSESGKSDGSGSGASSLDTGTSSSSGKWTQGKSIIKSFESEITSLYQLGETIGTALKTAMDGIDWDGIYKKTKNFGKGLASFLNGLISPGLFSTLGTTISNSINAALIGLNSFGETFGWENFGNSLGTGLTSFLNGNDWETALSTAKNFGTGIALAINSFLQTTDFDVVGSTVANAINTAIQFALSLGSTLDFKEFGNSISDTVNGFFATFDFKGLAETLNTWAQGIWTTITTAISGISWSDVWNGVKEFLENIDIETVAIIIGAVTIKEILGLHLASTALSMIGTALSRSIAQAIASKLGIEIAANAGIKTALTTGMTTAFTSIGTTFMAGLKGLFGSEAATSALAFISPITKAITGIGSVVAGVTLAVTNFFSMWKNGFSWLNEALMVLGIAVVAIGAVILGAPAAIAAAIAGAVAAIGTIAVVVKDNWGAIKKFFSDLWKNIKDIWGKASDWFVDNVAEPIYNVFSPIVEKIKGLFSNMWEGVKTIWSNVSNWFSEKVIEPIVTVFNGIKTRVQQVFNGLWIIIQAIWIVASTWFSDKVATPIKNVFNTVKTKVKNVFSTLWAAVKNVWSTVSTWFGDKVAKPIKDSFSAVKTKVSGVFTALWAAIKKVWENVSSWFSDKVISPLKDKWEKATDAISGFFASLWKGIKKGVGSAMNAVISGIENAVNGIVSGINGIIGGFNKIVTVAAKIVGADWSGVDKLSKVTLKRIDVTQYATGGFPEDGWFRASKGEYFGQFDDGTSYIANNKQIERGIAVEVSGAVRNANAEQNALLIEQNELLRQILNKNVGISSGEVFNAVRKENAVYKRRTGVGAFI